jgi:PilZ domain
VVSAEFAEDVVTCVDMSKGGVSFRTKKEYAKEMRVMIAVPYAPEAKEVPAIFVKGRIANVRALGNGMWRVGLEFSRG